MKHRRNFLAAARGRRAVRKGLVLQGRHRADDAPGVVQVGFTASRKVGGAVVRNRAKRRMRAAANFVLPEGGRAGWDYVLIARPGATAGRRFEFLTNDLMSAVSEVHADTRRNRKHG